MLDRRKQDPGGLAAIGGIARHVSLPVLVPPPC
jgi:hypothetical protein